MGWNMSRWAGLPENLDPRVRHLVAQLRRLKDASELSLSRLAARTGYSKSSWERYLSGRSLPPPEAVEALARLAGADPERLLALREVAADTWEGPPARRAGEDEPRTQPSTQPSTQPRTQPRTGPRESPRRRWRTVAVVTAVAAGILAVTAAALLTVRPWQSADASAPGAYTCRLARTGGHWSAGLSGTRDAILTQGSAGPDVAEAQCLLRRAGFPPGDIDGVYGDLTERAVKRLQARAGLVIDGKVGPYTWGALRG